MPNAVKQDFDEAISRARAIVAHARTLAPATPAERLVRDDLLRSAWMFAVGAMDAYFCDAYTEIITLSLRAKSLQTNVVLTQEISEIEVPIGTILTPYRRRQNWRWRMAARRMMERQNVLSLKEVQKLFNHFFRAQNKLFTDTVLDDWLKSAQAADRLFGIPKAKYLTLRGVAKADALKSAKTHLERRFKQVFQKRHDCIHTCDRPRTAIQQIGTSGTVMNVIRDIEFLVVHCDRLIDGEFRVFLQGLGCDAVTMNALGY
jgi:hypothetical protein